MDALEEFFHDRVHNKKWFTARGLAALSNVTGGSPDLVGKIIALIIFFLLIGQNAWVVCNSMLVVIPLLLTFTFPDERPPVENMRVYWISAFVVSAYDRMLEIFPLYYVSKLCVLLFLLVEPSCLNENLKRLLKVSDKSKASVLYEDEESRSGKSEHVESAESSQRSSLRRAEPPKSVSTAKPPSNEDTTDDESVAASSGAPTPYDPNPLIRTNVMQSGSVDARASTAPSPPVGVGARENLPSSYVNLPKPLAKQNISSVRVSPSPLRSNQQSRIAPLGATHASATDRKKIPNVSMYYNLPKASK